jgi:hypothetical protein
LSLWSASLLDENKNATLLCFLESEVFQTNTSFSPPFRSLAVPALLLSPSCIVRLDP